MIAQFKTVQPDLLEVPMENGRFDPDGKPTKCDKFSMGALSGWEMALEDMRPQGFIDFRAGDYVTIECTGVKPNANPEFSDMPEFRVSISDKRPSEKVEEKEKATA